MLCACSFQFVRYPFMDFKFTKFMMIHRSKVQWCHGPFLNFEISERCYRSTMFWLRNIYLWWGTVYTVHRTRTHNLSIKWNLDISACFASQWLQCTTNLHQCPHRFIQKIFSFYFVLINGIFCFVLFYSCFSSAGFQVYGFRIYIASQIYSTQFSISLNILNVCCSYWFSAFS